MGKMSRIILESYDYYELFSQMKKVKPEIWYFSKRIDIETMKTIYVCECYVMDDSG